MQILRLHKTGAVSALCLTEIKPQFNRVIHVSSSDTICNCKATTISFPRVESETFLSFYLLELTSFRQVSLRIEPSAVFKQTAALCGKKNSASHSFQHDQ